MGPEGEPARTDRKVTATEVENMEDETKWPAVDAAFTFVVPSYQLMLGRMEAADSRLHAMQVFVLTVTPALPTLAKLAADTINFRSYLFGAALAFAAASFAVGLVTRSSTRVVLFDPSELYKDGRWLTLSDWEFKKNMLFFAGQHFEKNRLLVLNKHRALVRMMVLCACEVLLLAAWFLRGA